ASGFQRCLAERAEHQDKVTLPRTDRRVRCELIHGAPEIVSDFAQRPRLACCLQFRPDLSGFGCFLVHKILSVMNGAGFGPAPDDCYSWLRPGLRSVSRSRETFSFRSSAVSAGRSGCATYSASTQVSAICTSWSGRPARVSRGGGGFSPVTVA